MAPWLSQSAQFKQTFELSLTSERCPYPREKQCRPGSSMGSIYLIRHGQASFGAKTMTCSPLGYRQSEALGDYLAQLGVSFDRCLSGELDRQQDTARATLARLGPTRS